MTKNSKTERLPRQLRIYRAGESLDFVPVIEPGHEIAPNDLKGLAEAGDAGWNDGMTVRVLLVDEKSGFNLTHLWMKPFYKLPNHSHSVDCAYYVVSGEACMGINVLKPGDSFMVPANCLYTYSAGPNGCEVVEFRNAIDYTFKFGKHPKTHWEKAVKTAQENAARWRDAEPSPSAARVLARE